MSEFSISRLAGHFCFRHFVGLLHLVVVLGVLVITPSVRSQDLPPAARREFRGLWIASVANIDWPSKPGLPAEQQREELIRIFSLARQMRLNAVILQVRPACDALYPSALEPWSEYLTGEMGKPPSPYYDPLRFAVTEAHQRGLELHAWFNPYRARHHSAKSSISSKHISRKHPELVRQYDGHLWLDPGEREVQKYSLQVILDVVRRYDIDGVHIDDYFYPYQGKTGGEFPDDRSWNAYQRAGGKLARDDWRRDSVNRFVYSLNQNIKKTKAWVKFGVSPFGIWRPGHPSQIKGKDAYAELYADSFKWFASGWLDYLAPQLYWKIDSPGQSYPLLLQWWAAQNFKGRHLWPGNNASNVDFRDWPPSEIARQVLLTRRVSGATGNVFFSARSFRNLKNGLANTLVKHCYPEPALIPASPWLGTETPKKPLLLTRRDSSRGLLHLEWKSDSRTKDWLWLVQTQRPRGWTTEILPGNQRFRSFSLDSSPLGPLQIAVSAVNRFGHQSPPARLTLKSKPSSMAR